MMPRNSDGTYADVVTDGTSVIKRMNVGRLYEHQISGAARDVSLRMRKIIGRDKVTKEWLLNQDDKLIEQLWNMSMQLHSCIGGVQYQTYLALTSKEDICEVLEDQINTYVKIFLPINHNKSLHQISTDIEKVVKPTYGKVIFNDPETGKEYISDKKIRIGSLYFILLNKIADDGSSVAIAKQQHFGVLTSSTKHDKYSNAWRNSPVRTDGESEVRIKLGYAGEELEAETMDLSNSSMSQREIYNNILTAEKPSNIERIIDRSKFPLGTSKPLQIIQHSLMCAGFRMESIPDPELVAKMTAASASTDNKTKD